MAEKKVSWTIVFPDWQFQLVKEHSAQSFKSFNAFVVDAVTQAIVAKMESDHVAHKQDGLGPNQRIVLHYVKRLEEQENRKPPSAADLHNWLKNIPVEVIEDSLELLTTKQKLERIVTPHTKRYRSIN